MALPQTMGLLSDGRISIAAQAVGMAQAACEHVLAYAKKLRTGKAIADRQAPPIEKPSPAKWLNAYAPLRYRSVAGMAIVPPPARAHLS